MLIDCTLKVKNYKCFKDEFVGFEKIFPINVIIGKNNSGKSSIIDLVEYAISEEKNLLIQESPNAECLLKIKANDDIFYSLGVYSSRSGGSRDYHIERIKKHYETFLKDSGISVKLKNNIGQDDFFDRSLFTPYLDSYRFVFSNLFNDYIFRRINAERDILAENFSPRENFNYSGQGATNLIWKLLNIKGSNQNLIKKDFLKALNKVINPDIEFLDIIIKEDGREQTGVSKGEIYFEIKDGVWVALSKMGSGVKTIMLVLLNLVVIPKLKEKQPNKIVFGFEELENNLHPSLLRRLFNFITDYAEKK